MANDTSKSFDKAMPEEKEQSSGDHSGAGRPRRDDGDVFPQGQRDLDQMGIHGGPKHHATGDAAEEPSRKEGE